MYEIKAEFTEDTFKFSQVDGWGETIPAACRRYSISVRPAKGSGVQVGERDCEVAFYSRANRWRAEQTRTESWVRSTPRGAYWTVEYPLAGGIYRLNWEANIPTKEHSGLGSTAHPSRA